MKKNACFFVKLLIFTQQKSQATMAKYIFSCMVIFLYLQWWQYFSFKERAHSAGIALDWFVVTTPSHQLHSATRAQGNSSGHERSVSITRTAKFFCWFLLAFHLLPPTSAKSLGVYLSSRTTDQLCLAASLEVRKMHAAAGPSSWRSILPSAQTLPCLLITLQREELHLCVTALWKDSCHLWPRVHLEGKLIYKIHRHAQIWRPHNWSTWRQLEASCRSAGNWVAYCTFYFTPTCDPKASLSTETALTLVSGLRWDLLGLNILRLIWLTTLTAGAAWCFSGARFTSSRTRWPGSSWATWQLAPCRAPAPAFGEIIGSARCYTGSL